MERLWRNGKSFAEASSALKVTSHTPSRVRQEVHRRLLAGPFDWLLRIPAVRRPAEQLRPRRTPFTGQESQTLRIRYNIDRDNLLRWIWERVQRLNPELISLMESLLGDRGHMIHVSPPAPGASLCMCVLLCVLLLFLFIHCHLFSVTLICLLGMLLCGLTADAS